MTNGYPDGDAHRFLVDLTDTSAMCFAVIRLHKFLEDIVYVIAYTQSCGILSQLYVRTEPVHSTNQVWTHVGTHSLMNVEAN